MYPLRSRDGEYYIEGVVGLTEHTRELSAASVTAIQDDAQASSGTTLA